MAYFTYAFYNFLSSCNPSLHKLEIVVARTNILAMGTCLSGSIGRSM